MTIDEVDRRILAAADGTARQLRWCDRRNAAFLTDAPGRALDVTDRVRELGRHQLLAFAGDQLETTRPGRDQLALA